MTSTGRPGCAARSPRRAMPGVTSSSSARTRSTGRSATRTDRRATPRSVTRPSQGGAADPVQTTSTWRDPNGPNQPENALTGEMYIGDNDSTTSRSSSPPRREPTGSTATRGLDAQPPGTSIGDRQNLVGWEWDARVANGAEPAGVKTLSGSPVTGELIQGTARATSRTSGNHVDGKYKAPSGALVFTTGTNHWNRGLGLNIIGEGEPDVRIRQITTNILADMGCVPATPASDLTIDDPNAPKPPAPTAVDATSNGSDAIQIAWTACDRRHGLQRLPHARAAGRAGSRSARKVNGTPVTGTTFTDTRPQPQHDLLLRRHVRGRRNAVECVERGRLRPPRSAGAADPHQHAAAPPTLRSSGATYKADVNFTGGSTNASSPSISGTADPALYQDERWGNFSYAIPVANGTYDVRFHFVELYYGTVVPGGVGKRVFSMDIGNTTAEPRPAEHRHLRGSRAERRVRPRRSAASRSRPASLNIQSVYGSADDPEVAAIEVIPAVTGPPTVTATQPTTGRHRRGDDYPAERDLLAGDGRNDDHPIELHPHARRRDRRAGDGRVQRDEQPGDTRSHGAARLGVELHGPARDDHQGRRRQATRRTRLVDVHDGRAKPADRGLDHARERCDQRRSVDGADGNVLPRDGRDDRDGRQLHVVEARTARSCRRP